MSARTGTVAGSGVRVPPFQALVVEHRGLVYRFAMASVGASDADDVFQETFLAALRTYPNLRHGDNLRAWLLAIAASKVADVGRRRSRRPLPAADAGALTDTGRGEDDAFDADDPLWRAVRALPERQRTAVVLRSVLDRPYVEVAAAMNCSEQTARAHVSQGLARLRRSLAQADDMEVTG